LKRLIERISLWEAIFKVFLSTVSKFELVINGQSLFQYLEKVQKDFLQKSPQEITELFHRFTVTILPTVEKANKKEFLCLKPFSRSFRFFLDTQLK